MFSALKKLTKSGDDRCPAPVPMSSSLQKKFSKGVHYNMKILIKGDRNVGKSCLLQRLQGGPFIEEYAPTEQIQVAPIHWTYKNTDHIVKVEVWEVVDKGKAKKKPPLGLKLDNQIPAADGENYDTPVLDATFLDVYKNANGVILMLDITKPWTFDYVVKEMAGVPIDLPIIVLGNHCDMQHHRQVHPHDIEQAIHDARSTRDAPVRYAESSMRNGFGLRLLHKFLNVPFLRLQKASLLAQLQKNQNDIEDAEHELDDYQKSDEALYSSFVERLTNKRRVSPSNSAAVLAERSPSIVLGAGKPIIPPNVNPLYAQTLAPKAPSIPPQQTIAAEPTEKKQTQYVSSDLVKNKTVNKSARNKSDSQSSTPSRSRPSGDLEEFYAGTLDSSFLEDLPSQTQIGGEDHYDTESDEDNAINPMVTAYQDDLESDNETSTTSTQAHRRVSNKKDEQEEFVNRLNKFSIDNTSNNKMSDLNSLNDEGLEMNLDVDYPLWAGDSSGRRSPEGGEDPDSTKVPEEKTEKKHKKKKSKEKDRGDSSEKSERKEKKHKHKKSKSDKPHPQQGLLLANEGSFYVDDEYDSI